MIFHIVFWCNFRYLRVLNGQPLLPPKEKIVLNHFCACVREQASKRERECIVQCAAGKNVVFKFIYLSNQNKVHGEGLLHAALLLSIKLL